MVIIMPRKKHIAPLTLEDKSFFQRFYEEYKGFLFYIAKQYTASQNECEDLVQDTLLRLLSNLEKLKSLDRNKTAKYIALTVKSAFLDREKQRRGSLEITLEDSLLEALQERECPILNRDADSHLRMELAELKQSLSARDWLVLEGKYILGYTQEELADLIGVTPDSIRMILCRARAKARKILLTDEANGGGHNG